MACGQYDQGPLTAHDDGVGGARPACGSALTGLQNPIDALGGTFSVHRLAGDGTTVRCELPFAADAGYP